MEVKRNDYIDIIKGTLICLVTIGHMIQMITNEGGRSVL